MRIVSGVHYKYISILLVYYRYIICILFQISVKQKLHSKEMHGLAKQLTVGAVQNLHS